MYRRVVRSQDRHVLLCVCVCGHINVTLAGVFSVTIEWRILLQIPVCLPIPPGAVYIEEQGVTSPHDVICCAVDTDLEEEEEGGEAFI